MFFPLTAVLVGAVLGADCGNDCGFLFQASYCIDQAPCGPAQPYLPHPGDIYLATDRSLIIRAGHMLAGSGAPHHSGIVVAMTDGRMGLLEAGPFNCVHIGFSDLQANLEKHTQRGEKIWIRQRRTPLATCQSEELTRWAGAQEGKWFAAGRMLLQLTPIRSRGLLQITGLGGPHGERNSYFCSELVLESCVHVGLLSPETTRPSATYPRELFFDQSPDHFLSAHFTLAPDWYPPARWASCPSN